LFLEIAKLVATSETTSLVDPYSKKKNKKKNKDKDKNKNRNKDKKLRDAIYLVDTMYQRDLVHVNDMLKLYKKFHFK
jgi:hypothetical protein